MFSSSLYWIEKLSSPHVLTIYLYSLQFGFVIILLTECGWVQYGGNIINDPAFNFKYL